MTEAILAVAVDRRCNKRLDVRSIIAAPQLGETSPVVGPGGEFASLRAS
jgi:hypothetical protein